MGDFLIKLIVVQTIIFGVVIFFLKLVLTKDTESSVNRLETSYEDVKKKKDEIAQRIKEIEDEYNRKKQEAENVASEIKDKATQEAYEIKESAFKRAKVESEDIITKAQKTINKIHDDIRKETETKMVERCGSMISRILSKTAVTQINNILWDEFLKELENANFGTIDSGVNSVDVVCAMPLDDKQRSKIGELLSVKLKKGLSLNETIDNSVLAGAILRFGTLTLDGSLASKINEIVLAEKQHIEERV
ncbi:MAG: F0F1 ATP synthase subunit delta [Candidatus Omnitrophica bacterium]|jgi:F0F1-type ATP synthase membrane subunit b/b'|nr:F0F1 ATP synthase subunit delta [Candidatus Omnitrophota bacterium]